MADISTTRATEQTLSQVYTAILNLTGAVQSLQGQFDSSNVSITSPTDFPDSGANIKLQSAIDELQSILAELQATLTVTGSVSVSNFPATFPDQHDQPLTDAEMRASDVEVNDDATQTILSTLRDSKFGDINTADTAIWELDQVRQELVAQSFPKEIFGYLIVAGRHNQIETSFFKGDPSSLPSVSVTKSGGATTSLHQGHGHFNTGTGGNGKVTAQTVNTVLYRPGHEVYAMFTAGFTTPTDPNNSHQRIGIFNTTDGFFIGYESGVPQITHRKNGVDTFHQRTTWDDKLDGSTGSGFTRNGAPEAIDLTKTNIFRIRFGWLGSADVIFEVLAPDGDWVEFHRLHFPNSDRHPSVTTPDLPLRLEVDKSASDGTDLEMVVGCWAAGTSADEAQLNEAINDRSLAKMVRAVITAKKPNGDYINISANNQGRLLFALGSVGSSGSPVPTDINQVGGEDPSGNIDAINIDADGDLLVSDTDATAELTTANQTLDDVKRAITDFETRLDYDVRTDGNPVYVGKATQGTATSTATWTIQKLDYDGSNRLTRVQVLVGAWSNRASLGWT